MGQFDDRVERQRLLLEAEEWAQTVKFIQMHSLSSMWYDTEESAKEIKENGAVTDTAFNSGLIFRRRNDKLIYTFGTELKGDALIDSYTQHTS